MGWTKGRIGAWAEVRYDQLFHELVSGIERDSILRWNFKLLKLEAYAKIIKWTLGQK